MACQTSQNEFASRKFTVYIQRMEKFLEEYQVRIPAARKLYQTELPSKEPMEADPQELEKILDIAQKLDFRVIVTTNGTLLGRRGASLLSSGAVHKINISLQSFEGNGEAEPGEYISMCIAFAKAAERAEKPCILRLWNKGGFDTLNGEILRALEEAFPKPWTESRGSMRIAGKVWLEEGERFDWPDLVAQDRGEKCLGRDLRNQIGVLVDGTVVPCCLDHDGDMGLGNLYGQSLDRIMASPRAQALYHGFTHHTAVEPLCRRCGYSAVSKQFRKQ